MTEDGAEGGRDQAGQDDLGPGTGVVEAGVSPAPVGVDVLGKVGHRGLGVGEDEELVAAAPGLAALGVLRPHEAKVQPGRRLQSGAHGIDLGDVLLADVDPLAGDEWDVVDGLAVAGELVDRLELEGRGRLVPEHLGPHRAPEAGHPEAVDLGGHRLVLPVGLLQGAHQDGVALGDVGGAHPLDVPGQGGKDVGDGRVRLRREGDLPDVGGGGGQAGGSHDHDPLLGAGGRPDGDRALGGHDHLVLGRLIAGDVDLLRLRSHNHPEAAQGGLGPVGHPARNHLGLRQGEHLVSLSRRRLDRGRDGGLDASFEVVAAVLPGSDGEPVDHPG